MKKYKFLAPYKKSGKTTFRATVGRAGVYLIKENGRLVYVGMSAKNLYRTLYRHFEKWHHSTQEVVTYVSKLKRNNYSVRVVLCTPSQADRLERALIVRHQPRDNENKFSQYTLTMADDKAIDNYNNLQIETEVPF
ncbi:MAG: hypothetical protein NTW16_00725 [Bacteroidetes bacterium]|nr:hypothetical protein [Bacteroidota bacterium]